MSKTKHTPGPWKYESETKTIRAAVPNYWLASMNSFDGAVDNEANARLIAAAPELLVLMHEVEEYLAATSANVNDPLWERVKEAIAKATGGAE